MDKIENILDDFASNVTRLSKINLGKYKTVDGKRRRIDNSGDLRRSLRYELLKTDKGYSVKFFMLDYGAYVDKGRKPGKGIPIDKLKSWIKSKPVRLRDLKTNRFIASTESRINSLSFLINRKIREKGIAPTNFLSEPLQDQLEKLNENLQNVVLEEMEEVIFNALNKIQS